MKGHGNHKSTNFKLKRFIHERERTLNKTKKYSHFSATYINGDENSLQLFNN